MAEKWNKMNRMFFKYFALLYLDPPVSLESGIFFEDLSVDELSNRKFEFPTGCCEFPIEMNKMEIGKLEASTIVSMLSLGSFNWPFVKIASTK